MKSLLIVGSGQYGQLIKEIAKSGTTHLKEWYKIYSGK